MGLLQALHLTPPARPKLPAGPVPIAIHKPGKPFEPGTEQQLGVTALLANGSPRDVTAHVDWSSSDEALVKVLRGGLAKVGRGKGRVTITARLAGGPPDSIEVMVRARLHDIVVTPADPLVERGETQTLVATAVYADGSTDVVTADVKWGSENEKVARFPSQGECKTIGPGTARVFAVDPDGEIGGSTRVTVFAPGKAPAVQKVTIEPLNPDVKGPAHVPFRAWGHYAGNAKHEITHKVVWESSHPNLLAISIDGIGIPGLGTGTALIRGMDGATGKFQSTTAYVAMPAVKTIRVSPTDLHMAVGQLAGVRVVADFHGGGQMRVNRLVTWTPTVPGIATPLGTTRNNVRADAAGETDFHLVEPLSGADDVLHVVVDP
jgi:hypothetical protein